MGFKLPGGTHVSPVDDIMSVEDDWSQDWMGDPYDGAATTDIATVVARALSKAAKVGSKATKGAENVAKRPSGFRKKTIQDAWDDAAPGSNPSSKACPTCGKDVNVAPGKGPRDWDVDHQPKWKDRDLGGLDRKGVLDEFNKDTRLRCPECNRADN